MLRCDASVHIRRSAAEMREAVVECAAARATTTTPRSATKLYPPQTHPSTTRFAFARRQSHYVDTNRCNAAVGGRWVRWWRRCGRGEATLRERCPLDDNLHTARCVSVIVHRKASKWIHSHAIDIIRHLMADKIATSARAACGGARSAAPPPAIRRCTSNCTAVCAAGDTSAAHPTRAQNTPRIAPSTTATSADTITCDTRGTHARAALRCDNDDV